MASSSAARTFASCVAILWPKWDSCSQKMLGLRYAVAVLTAKAVTMLLAMTRSCSSDGMGECADVQSGQQAGTVEVGHGGRDLYGDAGGFQVVREQGRLPAR